MNGLCKHWNDWGTFYRQQGWASRDSDLQIQANWSLWREVHQPMVGFHGLFFIMYPALMNFLFSHTPSPTQAETSRGPQEHFREMPFPRAVQNDFSEPAISGKTVLCVCRQAFWHTCWIQLKNAVQVCFPPVLLPSQILSKGRHESVLCSR